MFNGNDTVISCGHRCLLSAAPLPATPERRRERIKMWLRAGQVQTDPRRRTGMIVDFAGDQFAEANSAIAWRRDRCSRVNVSVPTTKLRSVCRAKWYQRTYRLPPPQWPAPPLVDVVPPEVKALQFPQVGLLSVGLPQAGLPQVGMPQVGLPQVP